MCLRFAFVLLLLFTEAGASTIDSLENAASKAKDTTRIKILLELSRKYRRQDLHKALSVAETALKESREHNSLLCEARSHYTIGGTYRLMAEYDKAFKALYTAREMMKTAGYQSGYAETVNVLGLTHYGNSNYDSAVYYYKEYLDFALKAKQKEKLPIAYNNIANVFYTQKNYDKAIEYYNEAISKCKEMGLNMHLSTMLNNLGAIYDDKSEYPKAKILFKEALVYADKMNDLKQQAAAHNNLGVLYRGTGTADSSLYHFKRSYELNKQIGDREGEALAILNLGALYTLKKQYPAAIEYLETSLNLSEEIGDQTLLRDVHRSLGDAYMGAGMFSKAAQSYKESGLLSDSLYNEENNRQINEMQAKYDTQKKENEIALLNKDKKLQEEQSQKQAVILNAVAAGLVLIIALSFVLFRSNKIKKKANDSLTRQKLELEKAYDMLNIANQQISTKNREITDSINYAKRIQMSLLPDRESIRQLFPESFIVYKPKDIVSGDFYWFGIVNGTKVIAIADCTGHGVPGALMSMIGHEKLLESLNETSAKDPGETLTLLDKKVTIALRQDNSFESAKDGMDIALVFIDEKNNNLLYSGANRPLLLRSEQAQGITAYKPTKASIGGRSDDKSSFKTEVIPFKKADSIYLFTDGYGDQIGGANSKKLLSKNFLLKINSLSERSFSEQQYDIDTFFDEWKGDHEQVDDVLVAGIRL